ncbi:hypothetical protein HBI56_111700 [Parastagonospora nodorum]|uniref:Uncharacterized protein n=1 Tax=Phaeosphaeria nodorum (strain SN15 / ATCC MYA-4574 / FGSC 10173) TaxID=321614 RepID=A0A7U2HW06_PHANO|nr:hypothetical protein HBH56_044320 [Parastagonospora nodorum]QRC92773.1 hypothetical protein JI435_081700 [Parastagonospora nodorum SN15]KAH3932990.1 hypothetical protein HBH54_072070 [Parastagonospora nodorum]KAH3946376.1 hypothetical protein HBH53_131260 [Parastagonospora nodorum]KAH3973170.1 hypothetical protein HBH52_144140 [Parastagonospora nodorum]
MDGTSITYATSKDWLDIMKNRSKVRMHELIERLGLRAKWSSNKRGKTNFESALVRELVADMGDVVATLPKEPEELMKFLSEEDSLQEEVDGLLEKHGGKIWGRAGDREHLITANEPGVDEGLYTRDLYIELEEDRKLIHKLLHWWIGLKACNVILARERLDRERRKKAENRQARAEAEHNSLNGEAPASFVALAPNSVLHDVDTGSRGSPMSSSAMLTPPESGESPIVGPREGAGFSAINGGASAHAVGGFSSVGANATSNGQQHQNIAEGVWSRLAPGERNGTRGASSLWPATNGHSADSKAPAHALAEQAAAERQITESVAQLVAGFRTGDVGPEKVPQSGASIPYRGLDYDSLRALRSYIYNEEGAVRVEEEVLLNRLERIWRELVRADSQKMLENVPVFIARERALLTWIELKRHMAAFERAEQRWASEGTTNAELERRHQQYCTLMGATETILINFEDVGQGFGVAPGLVVDKDELLRQAIVMLAGEKYAKEMQWKNIDFTATVRWLGEHLEAFRKDEEEEGRGTMWYVG